MSNTPPRTPVRRPSVAEINRMNKEELTRTLKELVAADTNGDEDGNIVTMLQIILDEVKTNRQERIKTEAEIKLLKECNAVLTNTVIQQQRFLESLDAEKRIRNLILTGIPEDTPLPTGDEETPEATTDEEKVTLILTKMNHGDVPVAAIHRLGKKEPTKNDSCNNDSCNTGECWRQEKYPQRHCQTKDSRQQLCQGICEKGYTSSYPERTEQNQEL